MQRAVHSTSLRSCSMAVATAGFCLGQITTGGVTGQVVDASNAPAPAADFFNIFNRLNFYQPGNSFGTPSFGVIGAAFDPRQVQFSLKYKF